MLRSSKGAAATVAERSQYSCRIAFGDIEGYVHFLDREDGTFSGRLRTEKSPLLPQMTALGTNGLLAQTRNGNLYAISIK